MSFVRCRKCNNLWEIEVGDGFGICPKCRSKYVINIEEEYDKENKEEIIYALLGEEVVE